MNIFKEHGGPKDGVVITSRRDGLAICTRPFLAVGCRDLAVFDFHSSPRRFQRLPDFFAAGVSSGIIAPGLILDQILMPRSLPRSVCFLAFH